MPWTARTPVLQHSAATAGWRPDRCDRIALVLQGGGALGAYQAGVYQALHEGEHRAGLGLPASRSAPSTPPSSPAIRAERPAASGCSEFWERITDRKVWHYTPDGDIYRKMPQRDELVQTDHRCRPARLLQAADVNALARARRRARRATSYYDTARCARRLLELVDFDAHQRRARSDFAVGAVNVLTGNFVYFDNRERRDRPGARHGQRRAAAGACRWSRSAPTISGTAASFPTRRCSICSTRRTGSNALVFQVDLFSARGVAAARYSRACSARHKDIMYSSRTRHNTDVCKQHEQPGRPTLQGARQQFRMTGSANDERSVARPSRRSAGNHHPADDLPAESL